MTARVAAGTAAERAGLTAGYRRQQGDLIAVVQDGVPLRKLFVYGDVKGSAQQVGDAAFEKVAHGGVFWQVDGFPLETGCLTQAGEQDETNIHGVSLPLWEVGSDRCQSPDLPPRFCRSWT